MKTPIIAASRARMKSENSLIFVVTDSQDDSSAMGVRNPVRTMSSRLMPSTPTK